MGKTILYYIKQTYESIIKLCEVICAIILLFMIVINTIGVFYRYVLANPLPWVPELSRYSLIWLTILGAVVALYKEEHVSITILYNKFPLKLKTILNIIKYILIGYFSYILIIAGVQYADTGYVGTFTGISGTYPRAIIPISGGLFLVISLQKLVNEVK